MTKSPYDASKHGLRSLYEKRDKPERRTEIQHMWDSFEHLTPGFVREYYTPAFKQFILGCIRASCDPEQYKDIERIVNDVKFPEDELQKLMERYRAELPSQTLL